MGPVYILAPINSCDTMQRASCACLCVGRITPAWVGYGHAHAHAHDASIINLTSSSSLGAPMSLRRSLTSCIVQSNMLTGRGLRALLNTPFTRSSSSIGQLSRDSSPILSHGAFCGSKTNLPWRQQLGWRPRLLPAPRAFRAPRRGARQGRPSLRPLHDGVTRRPCLRGRCRPRPSALRRAPREAAPAAPRRR